MLKSMMATRSFWVVIVSLVAFATAFATRNSYLQRAADQFFLDAAIQLEAGRQENKAVAPILLVKVNNADIASLGWPLDDAALQKILEILLAAEPAVVGLLSPVSAEAVIAAPAIANQFVVVGTVEGVTNGDVGVPVFPLNPQIDPDGVVRRVELMKVGPFAEQGLVAELALRWAQNSGLPSEVSDQYFRVGNNRIRRLHQDYANTRYHSWQALPYYSGTTRNLAEITVTQLLAQPELAALASGRIVLLGNMSEGYAARYPTPLARNILADYGVLTFPEIVAEQLSTILGVNTFGRTSFGALPDRYVDTGLAIVTVVLTLLYLAAASATKQLLVMLVAGVLIIATWVVGYLLGWILPLTVPLVLVSIQYLLQAISTASVEYSNRRALGNMLSRHLSSQVAQELWKKRHQVSGDGVIPTARTTATVLFTDVVGFTPLSERLEPEQLVAWLNRMITEVTKAVQTNGGTVDKFIGDAVMAVFGVPDFAQNEKQLKRQADNAVKASLAIRERLMALNGELAAQGLPVFQMRAGLHTGELVAGEIGSIDKTNYTVIGDTVNVAARIESKAGEYEAEGETITIVLSEETQCLVTLDAHFDELGIHNVKGRAAPLKLYRLNPSSGALIRDMAHNAPSAAQVEAAVGYMSKSAEQQPPEQEPKVTNIRGERSDAPVTKASSESSEEQTVAVSASPKDQPA